jgi:hypothetical protein
LTSCRNDGNITGQGNNTGGIVGYCSSYEGETIINKCSNTGAVAGLSKHVGGIVGECSKNSSIAFSHNAGSVTGQYDFTGGIVGNFTGNSLIKSFNSGNITGNNYTGGIAGGSAGAQNTFTMVSCFNTGGVSGYDTVGGIVGWLYNYNTVKDCYNRGAITCTRDYYRAHSGGIVGSSSGGSSILNCYNTAAITSTATLYCKAIAGEGSNSNCFYDNETCDRSDNYASGRTTAAMKDGTLIDLLNTGQSELPFKADLIPNNNDGYPILSWQE